MFLAFTILACVIRLVRNKINGLALEGILSNVYVDSFSCFEQVIFIWEDTFPIHLNWEEL